MFYVLIDDKSITVHNADEMLTLKEMQNLVGIENEPAYIEVASYHSYSDRSIIMICDDEFLLKSYKPTCYTAEKVVIHGQVLILGTDAANGDFGLLTLKQTEIIKQETKLYQR
ncbi:DUF3846 domain-containing protein [Microcoleus sp. A006_D1]|uniref:DUF3846 domain-containing protein n=1 Tax=Microcoleus sp. A006_D1 TaxID=3055267 RepID=UPI002FD18626